VLGAFERRREEEERKYVKQPFSSFHPFFLSFFKPAPVQGL
jgi:hypothetical protein